MVIDELIKRSEEGEPSYGWDTRTSMLMPWDLPAAEAHINSHPDHSSFHLLMATRRKYPGRYMQLRTECKASVFCDALTHADVLNEWGYLMEGGCREGEPALALIETGIAAIPFLRELLEDQSPALLDGPSAGTLSFSLHYRIADFAH
jgi:hypothetical protein